MSAASAGVALGIGRECPAPRQHDNRRNQKLEVRMETRIGAQALGEAVPVLCGLSV